MARLIELRVLHAVPRSSPSANTHQELRARLLDGQLTSTEPLGQPLRPPRCLSLSYSSDSGAIAWSDEPVGLDLEAVTPDADLSLLRKFFTPAEQQWLAGDKSRHLLLWTRKEAVLKLLGCGLRIDPASFDVVAGQLPLPPVPPALLSRQTRQHLSRQQTESDGRPTMSSQPRQPSSCQAQPAPAPRQPSVNARGEVEIHLASYRLNEPEPLILSVAAFSPIHLDSHQPSLAAAAMATALM